MIRICCCYCIASTPVHREAGRRNHNQWSTHNNLTYLLERISCLCKPDKSSHQQKLCSFCRFSPELEARPDSGGLTFLVRAGHYSIIWATVSDAPRNLRHRSLKFVIIYDGAGFARRLLPFKLRRRLLSIV